ncbi:MAG: imm11 family protein, partial [Thermoanaerobaculia bacterium]
NTVDDPFVADEGDLFDVEDWMLAEGVSITNWNSASWVKATKVENDGDPDDVLQTYMALLPIYSSRLRRELEAAGVSGIQYLPIRVLRPDDSEIPGYAIANVVNKIAALDFERSRYTLFPADWIIEERRGDVWTIERPVLLASALGGHHIIRLEEHTSSLFVSEHFKQVFEDGGFSGYSFREVALSR